MNAMAEKLEAAGVDTIGARLTTACVEALRKHPENSMDAWRHVGTIFGHEFIRGLMADMQRNNPQKEEASSPTPLSRDNHSIGGLSPYNRPPYKMPPYKKGKSGVISNERLEKRRELRQVVRSKYKNSGGICWSDVGWHELRGLKRDGGEAAALLNAGPANVPNDGRTVGDVLGINKTDEIIGAIRK